MFLQRKKLKSKQLAQEYQLKKLIYFYDFRPKKSANKLTGTAIKRIIEWTNSLSIESDTSPEVAIKNDGINKH